LGGIGELSQDLTFVRQPICRCRAERWHDLGSALLTFADARFGSASDDPSFMDSLRNEKLGRSKKVGSSPEFVGL
jgi:hypothetical protein